MGEFYELSESEAAELNADGGREPLTYDDYKPNRARGQEGATFRLYWNPKRVFKNPPGHRAAEELAAHGQSLYAVYDAKALWEWVKTREKDPTNTFQLTYEDWMQLYAEYGNFSPIPEFVDKLPSVEWPDFGPNTVWAYEESGVGERSEQPWTGGAWEATVDGAKRFRTYPNFTENSQKPDFLPSDGIYYSGPPDEERIIRARWGRSTDHFTGPRGREQLYKTVIPNGDTWFYATDEEPRASRYRTEPEYFSERARGRLQKIVNADGLTVYHFAGPKRHERLVYSERDLTSNTSVGLYTYVEQNHFTGKQGRERLYKIVRVRRVDGSVIDTHYMRGPREKEYAYKRVGGGDENNHWVAYYETGEEQQGALRRVEQVNRRGYDGDPAKGPFYLRAEMPYEGPVWIVRKVQYYEGPRGAETYVRTETTTTNPDGTWTMEPWVPTEEERAHLEQFFGRWVRKYSALAGVLHVAEPDNYLSDPDME
jgi:hypothetical protein